MLIIVVSGYSDKQTMIELMRNGCNDFLEKYFSLESVLERVAEASRKWFEARRWQEQKEYELEAQLQNLRRLLEGYEKRFPTLLNEQRNKEDKKSAWSCWGDQPRGCVVLWQRSVRLFSFYHVIPKTGGKS